MHDHAPWYWVGRKNVSRLICTRCRDCVHAAASTWALSTHTGSGRSSSALASPAICYKSSPKTFLWLICVGSTSWESCWTFQCRPLAHHCKTKRKLGTLSEQTSVVNPRQRLLTHRRGRGVANQQTTPHHHISSDNCLSALKLDINCPYSYKLTHSSYLLQMALASKFVARGKNLRGITKGTNYTNPNTKATRASVFCASLQGMKRMTIMSRCAIWNHIQSFAFLHRGWFSCWSIDWLIFEEKVSDQLGKFNRFAGSWRGIPFREMSVTVRHCPLVGKEAFPRTVSLHQENRRRLEGSLYSGDYKRVQTTWNVDLIDLWT